RTKRSIQLISAVAFWLLVSLAGAAPSPDITVGLTPQNINVGQTARLTVKVDGVRECDVSIGAVDQLVITYQGAVNNFQLINGVPSASVSHNYLVQAQEPGSYTISDISVDIDGTKHRAEPVSLKVTAGQRPSSSGTASQSDANPIAFIRFVPAQKTVYLGEIVPVQIKSYFKQCERFDQVSLPRFKAEGLLLDELGRNPKELEEMIDGVAYRVLVWDSFITGVKEGTFAVQVDIEATNLIPVRRRSPFTGFGSNLFDDDFFGDIFTGYDPRPLTPTSPETTFTVKGLPETARPEGFTGAVGDFSLELEATPTEIRVGEPITLSMSVSGTGNFSRVEAPAVSETDSLKLYTPHDTFTPGSSPHEGVKRFEQAAVITDPSVSRVPPVAFSFFYPDRGTYQTLFSDPVEVSVAPDPEATMNQGRLSGGTAPAAEQQTETSSSPAPSLLPVKLHGGRLVNEIRPPFLNPAFIAVLTLLLLSISSLLGYSAYQRLHVQSADARHNKALKACRKKTRELLGQLDPEDPAYPDRARGIVEELLILSQRSLNSSLTAADVAGFYGHDSAAAELFRLSDHLRYGRIGSNKPGSVQQLGELHHRLLASLEEL
ncbi:MAG: BatD family protein, partial [Desulfofustis sp.]